MPNRKTLAGRKAPLMVALVCLIAACAAAPSVLARPAARSWSKRERAAKAYQDALNLRAALEARRPESRSYKDYIKVARAFDFVYRTDRSYAKTPFAVQAEAALYQEMGHVLGNSRYFESAVATYQFLSDQYGGSAPARDALLKVGDIYRVDLGNTEEAAKAYSDYLTRYPYASHAVEARQRLKELNHREAAQADQAARAAEAQPNLETAPSPRAAAALPARLLNVSDVRYWEGTDYVRIVISVEDEAKFEAVRLQHPDRIVFDLPGTHLSQTLKGKSFPVGSGFLREIRVAQYKPDVSRVVLDVSKIDDYSFFTLPNPFRVVIDVRGPGQALMARSAPRPVVTLKPPTRTSTSHPRREPDATSSASVSSESSSSGRISTPEPAESSANEEDASVPATSPAEDASTAIPASATGGAFPGPVQPSAQTSSGSSTLTRALGLKIARIVIDPGHGGHDTGTIGPDGLEEKNVVLDVGLRLRKLIQQRMGSEVVMTRRDDTFIPLEERTAIANQRAADLFISIHANASRDPSARGIEVYYLNFTSDPNSLETAARENATSQESVHELQSMIKKIALSEKIQESSEFARQVDQSLDAATSRTGNEQPDRGLKKAPFVVLIGANMPSILAEISFLTNPRDERLLGESNYRQQIAEGLYRGIARYVANLGSMKIAQRTPALPPGGSTSRVRAVPPPSTSSGAPEY